MLASVSQTGCSGRLPKQESPPSSADPENLTNASAREQMAQDQDPGDGTPPPAVTLPPPRARVCLDPGHPAYFGDKPYEGLLNRKVVYYLSDLLVQNRFAVLITVIDISREAIFSDDFDIESPKQQARLRPVSVEDRVDTCHLWKSDFLISVHHNSGWHPKRNRAIVFYGMDDHFKPIHKQARRWAKITAKNLDQAMEVETSVAAADQRKLGFSLDILSSENYVGILTEASYYSIPEERKRLNTDDYLKGEAKAIFQGFLEFFENMKPKIK